MTAHETTTKGACTRRSLLTGLLPGAAIALAAPSGALAAQAMPAGLSFPSIDGGTLDLDAWRDRPVLLVNTASRCAFTGQYEGLQALYDRYREQGLIVLAVPSDDFRQELDSAEAVKEFCTLTFGLDLPMTDITHVRGPEAHPVYAWLSEAHGFRPRWNFNKALIAPCGRFAGSWGSATRPTAPALVGAIEALLPAG